LHSLSGLAERVLEVPDSASLVALLTRDLPKALGLASVTLLSWDRKLESFESLTSHETSGNPAKSAGETPQARYLLSDGVLIDTGAEKGDGTLVPLQARSGIIGMLLLPEKPGARHPPYGKAQVKQLSALCRRAALALENHLYQKELIASERLTALGTMAGMLVHDFRGPMTVIRGYAEMLAGAALSSDEVKSHAALITEMVDRLERMTTETLDFAREGKKLARRTIGLNRLLTTLCSEIAQELPGLRVSRDIQIPAELEAALDVDKLHRVVGNIAANARDAMGGKGGFEVAARVHEGRLVLTLADDGPGVPAEIAERLFDPFVTRGKKNGTGLGLAVARRFVEDHGGTIDLLPHGPGARFRITLPLTAPPPASAPARAL
jgi:signal transduction histidine kinase